MIIDELFKKLMKKILRIEHSKNYFEMEEKQ